MQFPSDFIEKYNKLLGDEAEEFFASFDQEAAVGFIKLWTLSNTVYEQVNHVHSQKTTKQVEV